MKNPRAQSQPALPPEILELARMLADQARDRQVAEPVATPLPGRGNVPAER